MLTKVCFMDSSTQLQNASPYTTPSSLRQPYGVSNSHSIHWRLSRGLSDLPKATCWKVVQLRPRPRFLDSKSSSLVSPRASRRSLWCISCLCQEPRTQMHRGASLLPCLVLLILSHRSLSPPPLGLCER